VCNAKDGELAVNAEYDDTTAVPTIKFLMESPYDPNAAMMRTPHTCCEVADSLVPEGGEPTQALCEDPAGAPGNTDLCQCGKFILDQKVEQKPEDQVTPEDYGDNVPSYCLKYDRTGNQDFYQETYRCVVTQGGDWEYWKWTLVPVSGDILDNLCPDATTCPGGCGTSFGTRAKPKPDDFNPYGQVWAYNVIKEYDPSKGVDVELTANFNGTACHSGSLCLDDPIVCEENNKGSKLKFNVSMQANYTLLHVDTVQTLNGNSITGTVPTNLLSTTDDTGALLVSPIDVVLTSISINDVPVNATQSGSNSDRNGDGFDDVRISISQADFQHAVVGNSICSPNEAEPITFKGIFDNGDAWIGPTTVKLVCN
jgi:hypothetical protein